MKPEAGDEGDDDVSKRGGGKHKREISPGERGEIAGEKADEQGNAESDPRGEDGCDQRYWMCERDGRELGHAA